MSDYFLTYLWTWMEFFSAILLFDAFSARKMERFRHWIIVTSLAFLEATFLNIASNVLPAYSKILIALVLYYFVHRILYISNRFFGLYISIIIYATMCCIDNLWHTLALLLSETLNGVFLGNALCQSMLVHGVIIAVCFLQAKARNGKLSQATNFRWYTIPAVLSFASVLLIFFFGSCFQQGQISIQPLCVCATFIPAILTSGTLAAAGNFDHTEQLLGLAAYKPLRHFSADSPFNYKKKCLLYLPQRRKERTDNRQLADEIVRLVHACCGHALVLFTSYRQMAEVKAMTDGRWPYPTFQAWRNGGRVIQQFKESGNGVLFAAGSCWEGIDFPGNMVSLLIIAKLPFPIPDPVSDYERQQYPNLRDYINVEIIPEMQKKLRQGFGRAIRTEQDSCVVAILDERAGIGGKYHDAALAALPSCPTTEKIEDVQQFIREQKRPDYFL